MNLLPSDRDEAFRAEVADWMRLHLGGCYEKPRHRGGPGDEEADPALRKQWERELAGGGWTCVGWPREAGGRSLSIEQQVIFHEEYARAGGPGRMGHIGDEVTVKAGDRGLRFLLVSGKPIREPVAWHGPIVMNTQAEIRQAMSDLRNGAFIK